MERLRSAALGALTVASVAMLLACGSDSDVTSTQPEDATGASATAPIDPDAPTTVVTTTEVPESTVSAPSTTVAETTTIPPTTAAVVPAGWVASGEFPDTVFPPCCASNWYGVASPAAPTDAAAPLADGLYHLTVAPWSGDRPDELDIEVRRFEQCSNLPEGACEVYETYAPDELGVEKGVIRSETVQLDDTVRAGVVGWADCTGDPQYGNGSDLAALIASYAAASEAVIAPRLAAAEEPYDILSSLSERPEGGFGPVTGECAARGEIVFSAGAGPELLMQTVVSYSTLAEADAYEPMPPLELLNPTVLSVEDGVYTLYFYAGFYS